MEELLIFLINCVGLFLVIESTSNFPPCENVVFCGGKLLHMVQMNRIYNDSKTFVDLQLKDSPFVTMKNFEQLITERNVTREILGNFVNSSFIPSNNSFELWEPEDWSPEPPILNEVKEEVVRNFLKDLNDIWRTLGRKVNVNLRDHPELNSLIYYPYGSIVPGGRFHEFYYWDTYWVFEGILRCGMYSTARGMLLNFAQSVNRFGHIPNGGRIYYTNRSQPPLFIQMASIYLNFTQDKDLIRQLLGSLEKEFEFWMQHHTVEMFNNSTLLLFRYFVELSTPRPESYREDFHMSLKLKNGEEKRKFYSNLAAACESGWDFSLRWLPMTYRDQKDQLRRDSSILSTYQKNKYFKISSNHSTSQMPFSLLNIMTNDIIPVDLNSFMFRNAKILSDFHKLLTGDEIKVLQYRSIAQRIQNGINEVLWNDIHGSWFDYDLREMNHRTKFYYISSLTPLYVKCQRSIKQEYRAISYAVQNYMFSYNYGIPTSMVQSGQQWDFPNAWAPLTDVIVSAFHQSQDERIRSLGKNLALRWVKTNYEEFKRTGQMFEKYNVVTGKRGGGGEYIVQDGFGWSNGVIFKFINMYPDDIAKVLDMDWSQMTIDKGEELCEIKGNITIDNSCLGNVVPNIRSNSTNLILISLIAILCLSIL
ncbi:hypothetical protein SNEBB_000773 [Seison nebaliae]|nr:hypothetical protein SNEBB_000773 [Seison nebaliae]